MTRDQLRMIRNAEPFKPFTLYIRDGRILSINDAQSLSIGMTVVAVLSRMDSVQLVQLEDVVGFEYGDTGERLEDA